MSYATNDYSTLHFSLVSLRYSPLPCLVDQPSRKRRQVLPSDALPQLAPLTKPVLSPLDVPGL